MTINRREALGALSGAVGAGALGAGRAGAGLYGAGAFGAAGLAATGAAAAAGRGGDFDPANQDHLALAFRKLAYSMDDTLTFWWMRGTRYGVVGSVATPFWDMYVAAWFTTRDLPDGRYEVRMASGNLYTPVGGTTLLEKFANPYTGKTVDVNYNRPKAFTATYDKKGGSPFAGSDPPGMKSTRQTDVGPAWIVGDVLHVQGDLMLDSRPLEAGKKSFTVNDWSTYIGAVADVMDPRKKNPPAAQMFNDILDFPGWLQMGDHPGTFVSRCYGRKVYDIKSMPAVWLSLFEKKFPDVAKDPGAVLRA
jgi:hypothetical protein